MSEEIQKSDTSVCSSSSARGFSSSRGRGGGYVPKKKIHEQIQSLELNESMGKDGTVTTISPLKKAGTDSSSSDSDSDLELAQGKRCDFCGDASHQNRDCPILEQIDDQPGNVKKVSCYYCHEEGHVKADCPKLSAKGCCFYCKKEGHVKANCPEKARLEMKKQERIKLNYTFRNRKTSQERSSSTSTAVLNVYEGPQKEENGSSDSSARPQVFVPLPIAPSQIKPQVQLRSKLMSSDSELSAQQKIIRSESSEEEDEMDSFDEDNSKENHPEEAAKKEIAADQEGNEKDKAEGGDGELQTISLEIDGCVEFDSSDDDHSFFDCSEGEDEEGNKLKRIVEEDECYGEDGAMLCDDGPEVKEPMEMGVKEGDAGETKPTELKEQEVPKEEQSPSALA